MTGGGLMGGLKSRAGIVGLVAGCSYALMQTGIVSLAVVGHNASLAAADGASMRGGDMATPGYPDDHAPVESSVPRGIEGGDDGRGTGSQMANGDANSRRLGGGRSRSQSPSMSPSQANMSVSSRRVGSASRPASSSTIRKQKRKRNIIIFSVIAVVLLLVVVGGLLIWRSQRKKTADGSGKDKDKDKKEEEEKKKKEEETKKKKEEETKKKKLAETGEEEPKDKVVEQGTDGKPQGTDGKPQGTDGKPQDTDGKQPQGVDGKQPQGGDGKQSGADEKQPQGGDGKQSGADGKEQVTDPTQTSTSGGGVGGDDPKLGTDKSQKSIDEELEKNRLDTASGGGGGSTGVQESEQEKKDRLARENELKIQKENELRAQKENELRAQKENELKLQKEKELKAQKEHEEHQARLRQLYAQAESEIKDKRQEILNELIGAHREQAIEHIKEQNQDMDADGEDFKTLLMAMDDEILQRAEEDMDKQLPQQESTAAAYKDLLAHHNMTDPKFPKTEG